MVNNSEGDSLNFGWTVSSPATVIINNETSETPTIIFEQVGEYIIELTASNEVCGVDTWTDKVKVSESPEVVLNTIPDFCSGAELDFSDLVSYPNQSLVDSVRWTFEGSQTPSSTEFYTYRNSIR